MAKLASLQLETAKPDVAADYGAVRKSRRIAVRKAAPKASAPPSPRRRKAKRPRAASQKEEAPEALAPVLPPPALPATPIPAITPAIAPLCIVQPLPGAVCVLGEKDPFSDDDEDVVQGMHRPQASMSMEEDELFSQACSSQWRASAPQVAVGGGTGLAGRRVVVGASRMLMYADLGESDSDDMVPMTQGK